MEKVTVILPYFNREDSLASAISSVLEQSHGELTLVLVDDGSTDRSAEVARSFEDSRILHAGDGINRGASSARNRGLELARHGLVAFMDSDDRWLPSKLERQVAFLRQEQARGINVSVVGCGWRYIGGSADRTFKRGPFDRAAVLHGVSGAGTPMLLIDRQRAAPAYFDTRLPALEERDYVLSCLANRTLMSVAAEILAEVGRGRTDHVANASRASRAWSIYLEKYAGELGSDPQLKSWYYFRAAREALNSGDARLALGRAPTALRHDSARRFIHLSMALVAREIGLAIAQRVVPVRPPVARAWSNS